jgi:hypothetical protein
MTTTLGEQIDRERTRRVIKAVTKHKGPGDHPGGTPQSTHGRGARNASARVIDEETESEGGITVRTMTGERPESGFAVALSEHSLVLPHARANPDRIGRYIADKYDTLNQPGFYFGSWNDTEKGQVALDVSKVMDSDDYPQAFERAVRFGQKGGEDAIYDFRSGDTIYLDDESIQEYRQQLAA